MPPMPDPRDWFLSRDERGNPATRLDEAHPDAAFTTGNLARPLVHGATYFAELRRCVEATGEGDLVWFTDWQSNPDQRLDDDPASELVEVLGRALERGVDVRALVWRSQSGLFGYAHDEHRDLGALLQERGGDVQLDMRVTRVGAHHQKFCVVRHRDDPTRDIAFVGGIDLCHGRRDDALHHGDPQSIHVADEYGERPPWHDVQLAVQGPVVHDVETVFRERWEDSTPTSRNPVRRWRDARADLDEAQRPLPPQAPPPPEVPGADHAVQLLRTYPVLGAGWAFDFAPRGERSVARGYTKAVRHARELVYVEDQFLWGHEMSSVLVDALQENPGLHLVAVLPQYPDQDGWFARDPQVLGRLRGVQRLLLEAPDRVAFYGLENHAGTPVYVHAKVCVLDDSWASIGSDNFCRRSWTNDSELSAAVIDRGTDGDRAGFARRLRLTLAAEHLDRLDPDELTCLDDMDDAGLLEVMADCVDPAEMFARFAASADALEAWHDGGRVGERPPGRLRRLPEPRLPLARQLLAVPGYQLLHDPDGRSLSMRRRKRF
ncbi:phosphatidylserine/phosphatidylglycerophosphate/cardiolipin synthase-like enzyme [Nocardioides marinisabuli]|uniref:Phosphatidylserine/phosphatidylglycerophosphate/ cardiolipin synthase-like enzyme n=1 Tax=Nocardioides marinisabuli TaxID=419476 RepID=A0A7Y9EZN3_9ACTN|nr:phospholipase [Nocardioides marinisabuli]NYD56651.1 phosphatidylserine/phosphatidylglycerophosphate/cardiolipin synthase-like enzyme [Nocardioides marinisabuli]